MWCANCDHPRDTHEHYRAGTECSFVGPAGQRCLCTRFGHPLPGRVFRGWNRFMMWLDRWR